ncbi:MAG: hypothetical protein K6F53_12260 [Lachnospiraceae bacterium]|nr:hypothetical protein [Lachnospiraceae bacterium]
MYSAENPDGKYVIEYGTNTATGTGTYTVIGVGEYGGKKSGRFSILSRILRK